MKRYFLFWLIVVATLLSFEAFGANKYWYGHTNTDFNTASNWSTSNTSYVAASAIPGTADIANFGNYTGITNAKCALSANISVAGLVLASGYTDTLSQGTYTITVGTSNASFSGGVFNGGSGNIASTGTWTISGSTFISTSGTFSTSANFTYSSGTFTHNSGKMKFTATSTITGSVTMYDLEFYPTASSTYTIASGTTLTVNNNLYYSGTSALVINTGTIDVKKDIYLSSTSTATTGGNATVKVTGTTKQTIYGSNQVKGPLQNFTINKSDTLVLKDTVTFTGNFTYTAGVISAGTSTVVFKDGVTKTISGNISLNNVVFSQYTNNSSWTISSGNTITVNGAFKYMGDQGLTLNTGTIAIKGDFTNSSTSNIGGGTAKLLFNGSGTQKLTGTTSSGDGRLCDVEINKSSSDSLKLYNLITVVGDWTCTSGILSAGSSYVYFYNTKTITGSQTLNNVIFTGNTTATFTLASGTTITVNGTLTKANGANITILNGGNIYAKGDITSTNSATGGAGSTIITINGTGDQTLTGSTSSGNGQLPNVVINKSSGTLYFVNTVTFGGDWTYTAGTISLGTSTVYFKESKDITGSFTFNDVTFGGINPATYTIASGTTLTINGKMLMGSSASIIINGGNIYAKGDIQVTNVATAGGGGTTITINGTGNQSFTGNNTPGGGRMPNIVINKSSGTLTLSQTITMNGDWTYTAGTLDAGTSTVYFHTNNIITGTQSLYNVTFSPVTGYPTYTVASGSTLTVLGTLTTATANTLSLVGQIYAKGDINVGNTGSSSGGSGTITINGTGNQTLTGSGTAGSGKLPNITIDKSSGTLSLASVISVTGNWIYTHGTVSPGTSTVALYGTFNLDGQESGTSTCMPFYKLAAAANTRTLTGNLKVTNVLTVSSGATLTAGSYAIETWGFNGTGTWNYNTSTVTFTGTGYASIKSASGASTNFYDVVFNRTSGSISLLNPMIVNHAMTLTKAHIQSTSTNYLSFVDNATLSGGSDSAYVHGPVRKTGNDAFTFPLGDTTLNDTAYHPLTITPPTSTSDQFEAQYLAQASSHAGGTLADTLEAVSNVEYWTIEQKVGTGTPVTVTVAWNRNSIYTTGTEEMTLAKWSGTQWDLMQTAILSYSPPKGSLITLTPYTFSGPVHISIGVRKLNSLFVPSVPILDGATTRSYGKKLYVIYDEKYKAGSLSYTIYDMGHNPISTSASPVTKVYGRNWFKINLAPISGLTINNYYVLEIQNDKGQKEYVRFCLK